MAMDGRIAPPPAYPVQPRLAQAMARDAFGREIVDPSSSSASSGSSGGGQFGAGDPGGGSPFGGMASGSDSAGKPKEKATDAIARRAGALMDEIAFPTFVASLLHGTYDAIVDASIKQVEGFADPGRKTRLTCLSKSSR